MGKISLARFWERGYPALISIAVLCLVWRLGLRFDEARVSNQLSSAINISAILMGFTGTANAMLLSFNSKRFQAIRNNHQLWQLLLSYFRSALWSSIILCFVSLALFSFDLKLLADVNIWRFNGQDAVMPVWIAFLTFALLSFFRMLRAVFALLKLA